MKNKILKLREQGKSYREIKALLGCSKATISYHCGEGQKAKNNARSKRYKSKNYLIAKVDAWSRPRIAIQTRDFINMKKNNRHKFTHQDVLKKFGMETVCYLSGVEIHLLANKKYHFDHIVPASRGGDSSINNLGILHRTVNKMKHNLTNTEFLRWCKKILIHNGYEVKLKKNKPV